MNIRERKRKKMIGYRTKKTMGIQGTLVRLLLFSRMNSCLVRGLHTTPYSGEIRGPSCAHRKFCDDLASACHTEACLIPLCPTESLFLWYVCVPGFGCGICVCEERWSTESMIKVQQNYTKNIWVTVQESVYAKATRMALYHVPRP